MYIVYLTDRLLESVVGLELGVKAFISGFLEKDDEEETEEEEEHVVVVGFIIIIAFTRRHTKCCMCTCFVLCGNSDVRIFKNLPNARKTPDKFPSVMVLKMQDEQREECSCSYY